MAEGLRVTCDGSHSHKHIIGLSGGRNRSEQAARYPNRLVDSILELYQKSTQHSHIHVLSLEELLDECHGADHLMQQIEADVADQPLVQDLQAVEEEQLPLPLESGDNPAESPGEVRSLPLEESEFGKSCEAGSLWFGTYWERTFSQYTQTCQSTS